jgi:DNA mismatch repair ATPase MutL
MLILGLAMTGSSKLFLLHAVQVGHLFFAISKKLTLLDIPKIRNAAQYISIDGRPVTADRGTVKQIVKLYKQYLQAAHDSSEKLSISRPFLYLQIKCPPESYDVNVEPAKDEVLFFRPTDLLSLLEKLFKTVYPLREQNRRDCQLRTEVLQGSSPSNKIDYNVSPIDEHVTETAQGRLQDDLDSLTPKDDTLLSNIAVSNPFTIAAMTAKVLPKKMDCTGAYASAPSGERSKTPATEQNSARELTGTRTHQTPLGQKTQLPSPIASSDDAVPYQNPGPPLRRHAKLPPRQNAEQGPEPQNIGSTNDGGSPDKNTFLQTWLTPRTGERRSFREEVQRTKLAAQESDDIDVQERQLLSDVNNFFPTAANSSLGLKWGPGQKAFRSPLKHSPNGQKPTGMATVLPSTLHDRSESVSSSTSPTITGASYARQEPRTALNRTSPSSLSRVQQVAQEPTLSEESSQRTELEDILEFEHRKKVAIAQQRRSAAKFPSRSINDILKSRAVGSSLVTLHHSETSTTPTGGKAPSVLDDGDFAARFGDVHTASSQKSKSNPHHNRYLAAVKDLSHSHPSFAAASLNGLSPSASQDGLSFTRSREEVATTPLPENDPRAYFIRQRQRGGSSTLYRTKSSRLPLETIPADMMTLHLVQTVNVFRNPQYTPTLVQYLSNHDRYIIEGGIAFEELGDSSSSKVWQETIRELIKKTYRSQDGEDMRMWIDDFDINLPADPG